MKKAKADKKVNNGSLKELFKHPRAVATVVGLTLGGTLAFYTYTTYMQKFLVNTVHLTKAQSTLLMFIALLIYAVLQPLFGMLSDRIGRTSPADRFWHCWYFVYGADHDDAQ